MASPDRPIPTEVQVWRSSAICRWTISRRSSCTLIATRITDSFKRRRINSFCSLCRRRRRFALPSNGRAGRRERPEPTSTTSCVDASHARSALRNDRAPSRPWPIGSIPRSSSASRRRRRVPSVPSSGSEGHIERHVRRIGDRATDQQPMIPGRRLQAKQTKTSPVIEPRTFRSLASGQAPPVVRQISPPPGPPPCACENRPSSISRCRERRGHKACHGFPA